MAVSKPLPGVPIDRTAPLAQNVASFWTLNEGAGTAFLDSAGNSPGAASGVVVRSQGGIVLSGSSYVALGKEYLEVNKKFSFVTRIKTTTGNQCAIAATWASGSKAGFYVLLNFSAGKLSVGMASASNGAHIQKDATKSVLDGVEHVIGFDYDASQTLAGLTIYIDGQLAAITNTYIAGTIGAFSHTGFNLGADGAGNRKYVGNIGYAGLFVGGNLGAAGHAAIAQNPWQLWPDEPQLVFAPASGTIIAVDGCSVGTSLDSSYLASYFAAQAISNAMASASSVQSSTAGVNAQGVSQASWNGLSASINGVDGASVAASASSVQTATILVLDANGSAVSCAISSVITQDVMVLSADGVTNGQALFQVDFSATAGVDGVAAGQAIGIAGQSAIVNVSGSASATSAASAGAAIVLSSDGASESSSIVVGLGLGIFGADGAAGSAVGYATSSVDVQSIGAVSGSAIGHVAGDTFSGATATVSGTSRAHSVVTGQLAGVIGKDGRDVAVAVARAPKAIVLAKDARSESNSVTKAGRAGIGAATGRSESQAIARGDATTTITANYPIAIDLTTVPPDSWMVLIPLETTTAAVSVYGDDATVPQEVTTVTVQSDDAVPVPVDTWKATA